MEAVVLAGQRNDGRLHDVAAVEYEALIPIAGRPMVDWVVEALLGHPAIERVRVVGVATPAPRISVISPGHTLWENIRRGLEGMDRDVPTVVATADIPLLRPEIVEALLAAAARDREMIYPLVPESAVKAQFPTAQRTYFRFREGVYTGGNLFVVKPRVAGTLAAAAPRLLDHRKSPWKLARDVGAGVLVKFLLGRLTLREVEAKAGRLLGIDGRALVFPYPEVGMDVDKPSDLALVEAAIRRREQEGPHA
jgi:GTP:adenosylcobinamide-phosphate guanylyltransferase